MMPTGGVAPSEENLRAWFEAGVVCVGMGSNLVRKDLVTAGDFAAIRDLARQTLALIQSIRPQDKTLF